VDTELYVTQGRVGPFKKEDRTGFYLFSRFRRGQNARSRVSTEHMVRTEDGCPTGGVSKRECLRRFSKGSKQRVS